MGRYPDRNAGCSDGAKDLASSLHYARFAEVAGAWRRGPSTFDAADLIFHDGVHAVICQVGCYDTTVPTAVQEMRDRANGWVERLWERGAPVEGAAWTSAPAVDPSTSPPSPGIQTFHWPLAQDLDAIALDQGDPMAVLVGRGTRIDEPNASLLRDIRASYAHGDHGAFFYQYLPAVSDSGDYSSCARAPLPRTHTHTSANPV